MQDRAIAQMKAYAPRFFTLPELCTSEKAKALGIVNVPDFEDLPKLLYLCEHVLDPLRLAWGKPLRVTSCFRTPALNTAIGGARNSQHMCDGPWAAADIDAGGKEENKAMFELAISLGVPFTQLIDEQGYRWVHIGVGMTPKDNKRQVLHI